MPSPFPIRPLLLPARERPRDRTNTDRQTFQGRKAETNSGPDSLAHQKPLQQNSDSLQVRFRNRSSKKSSLRSSSTETAACHRPRGVTLEAQFLGRGALSPTELLSTHTCDIAIAITVSCELLFSGTFCFQSLGPTKPWDPVHGGLSQPRMRATCRPVPPAWSWSTLNHKIPRQAVWVQRSWWWTHMVVRVIPDLGCRCVIAEVDEDSLSPLSRACCSPDEALWDSFGGCADTKR